LSHRGAPNPIAGGTWIPPPPPPLEGVGGRATWDPTAAARLESAVAAGKSGLETRLGQQGRMDWWGRWGGVLGRDGPWASQVGLIGSG